MGTLNYTVGVYARDRNKNIMATDYRTSDAFTSSTAAANVTDGSGAITLSAGEVFRAHMDEAAWIRFGGVTATVGDGFYIPPDQSFEWECDTPGTVSIIDVA